MLKLMLGRVWDTVPAGLRADRDDVRGELALVCRDRKGMGDPARFWTLVADALRATAAGLPDDGAKQTPLSALTAWPEGAHNVVTSGRRPTRGE
jgi:hypothetical protein